MSLKKEQNIGNFAPSGMEGLIESWVLGLEARVRVVNPRRTKTGDFRIPRPGMRPVITVNSQMNPVEFVITLAHELAHYIVWERYGRRARPHGEEWKREFRLLLGQVIETGILPPRVNKAIVACYFKRERIGSGMCVKLFDEIHEEGMNRASQGASEGGGGVGLGLGVSVSMGVRVRDVAEGERFTLKNGKQFVRGPKLRTRYRCREVGTGRSFTVHPLAEVATDAS